MFIITSLERYGGPTYATLELAKEAYRELVTEAKKRAKGAWGQVRVEGWDNDGLPACSVEACKGGPIWATFAIRKL